MYQENFLLCGTRLFIRKCCKFASANLIKFKVGINGNTSTEPS